MTKHKGDAAHRFKDHPKTPKVSKCRECRTPLGERPVVRKGGSRYHEECLNQ